MLLRIVRKRTGTVPSDVVVIEDVQNPFKYKYYNMAELIGLFDPEFRNRFDEVYTDELSTHFALLTVMIGKDENSRDEDVERMLLIDCEAFLMDSDSKKTIQAVKPLSIPDAS